MHIPVWCRPVYISMIHFEVALVIVVRLRYRQQSCFEIRILSFFKSGCDIEIPLRVKSCCTWKKARQNYQLVRFFFWGEGNGIKNLGGSWAGNFPVTKGRSFFHFSSMHVPVWCRPVYISMIHFEVALVVFVGLRYRWADRTVMTQYCWCCILRIVYDGTQKCRLVFSCTKLKKNSIFCENSLLVLFPAE